MGLSLRSIKYTYLFNGKLKNRSCTPDRVIKSCNTTDQRISKCDILRSLTRTGGRMDGPFFLFFSQPNSHGAPLESSAMTVIASAILIT